MVNLEYPVHVVDCYGHLVLDQVVQKQAVFSELLTMTSYHAGQLVTHEKSFPLRIVTTIMKFLE